MAKKLKKKLPKTSPVKAKLINPSSEEKVGGEEIKKTKIRVIGIGGGGGNIVSEIALKYQKPVLL